MATLVLIMALSLANMAASAHSYRSLGCWADHSKGAISGGIRFTNKDDPIAACQVIKINLLRLIDEINVIFCNYIYCQIIFSEKNIFSLVVFRIRPLFRHTQWRTIGLYSQCRESNTTNASRLRTPAKHTENTEDRKLALAEKAEIWLIVFTWSPKKVRKRGNLCIRK